MKDRLKMLAYLSVICMIQTANAADPIVLKAGDFNRDGTWEKVGWCWHGSASNHVWIVHKPANPNGGVTGQMWTTFKGPSGKYDMDIGIHMKMNGQSLWEVQVNKNKVAGGKSPWPENRCESKGDQCLPIHAADNVQINNGDEIRYIGKTTKGSCVGGGVYAGWYELKLFPKGGTAPPPPPPPPPQTECGNGKCENGEDCKNCEKDCGACPPPPQTGEFIKEVKAASGKSYSVGTLRSGAKLYIDRDYTFSNVGSYKDLEFIRTANDDKTNSSQSFLTIELGKPAKVCVAYDSRASSIPGWLSEWKAAGNTVTTSDVDLKVFEKSFAAGSVVLGGNNAQGAAGAGAMYSVFAGEFDQATRAALNRHSNTTEAMGFVFIGSKAANASFQLHFAQSGAYSFELYSLSGQLVYSHNGTSAGAGIIRLDTPSSALSHALLGVLKQNGKKLSRIITIGQQ